MQHTFQIKTSELGSSFIESVKSLFASKEIRIVVEEVDVNASSKTQSDVARLLQHRREHPPIILNDSRDFNSIVDDQDL